MIKRLIWTVYMDPDVLKKADKLNLSLQFTDTYISLDLNSLTHCGLVMANSVTSSCLIDIKPLLEPMVLIGPFKQISVKFKSKPIVTKKCLLQNDNHFGHTY